MEDEQQKTDKRDLYNSKSILIYMAVIAMMLMSEDNSITFFGLIISTIYTTLWTFVSGTAIYICAALLTGTINCKGEMHRFIVEKGYVLIPMIGFLMFLFIAFN